MPGSNNAAGAQPGPLPRIVHLTPAPDHFLPGKGTPKTKAVLHNTVGTDSAPWLSTTSRPPVSIHVLVRRDGVRVNIVDYADTAWHVGNARAGYLNRNCLGIELESTNDPRNPHGNGYTVPQLNTAAHCVATWLYSYGLDFDRDVVRHGDIAIPAGRRHDPWGLDMAAFRAQTLAWFAWFHTVPAVERDRWII